MTTRLRLIGAAFMGILKPVPSPTSSPMTGEEGAWIRAHAWTKALRRIDDAYPHGFHRWCSCERGVCHPCDSGRHDQCISADGPRIDKDAGTMTDRGGFVVAMIHYAAGQRPCRWNCPCTHAADDDQPTDATPAPSQDVRHTPPCSPLRAAPAAQLSLFPDADQHEEPADGKAV
ncbi:DUF6248 family natural product biosynthesis protein [Streptomyces sp. NPDC005808]|uniref:DUF6248 family natural product biosynthesis protein n=1 Tax=Streptomyces sp. NPDC005808 TaxID=3364734 RepID=UPI0036764CDA